MEMTQADIFSLLIKAHKAGTQGLSWTEFAKLENIGKYFPITIFDELIESQKVVNRKDKD